MGLRSTSLRFGTFPQGKRNLITDVPGVMVGHVTLASGDIQTGVTTIVPASGNLYEQKIAAACHVINGFGKSAGLIQVAEMGVIETPIVLTNTFSVGMALNALIRLCLADNPDVGVKTSTVNAVALECNDGVLLNDIRGMHVTEQNVFDAIQCASENFGEGSVGAGRGMRCYGLKGGIGSASRVIDIKNTQYTVGTLLLTNFGKTPDLRIGQIPVGQMLSEDNPTPDKGSCIMIIATDIPLDSRQMERVCHRAQSGLARTGAYVSNGSGEIALMFSTASRISHYSTETFVNRKVLHESFLDSIFSAVTDCIEESVISSLVHAETVTGRGGATCKCLNDKLKDLGYETY